MAMTSYVYGIIPPDDMWQSMKTIWDACITANIVPPKEVVDFFKGEAPDPSGVVMHLASWRELHSCTQEYSKEMCVGYEVDITKLPPHVKIIRFVNSY
jgi:hypothetical protein